MRNLLHLLLAATLFSACGDDSSADDAGLDALTPDDTAGDVALDAPAPDDTGGDVPATDAQDTGPVVVSGVDGALAPETMVTVNGSGFGTKSHPGPWVWDVLDHASYAGLSNGDAIPVRNEGEPSALYGSLDGSVVFRDDHPNLRVPGRPMYSCEGRFGVLTEIGRPHDDDEFLYLDYWVYTTSAREQLHEDGADFVKIHRIWPTPAGNAWGHSSVYPGRVAYERGPLSSDGTSDYGDILASEGEWHHIAGWYDSSGALNLDGTSEGIIQYWGDNQQVVDISDNGYRADSRARPDEMPPRPAEPLPDSASGFTYVRSIGVETGGGLSLDHTGFVNLWGDIYIDNTLARVAVGDAPNWADVRHYELQIPEAWADGAVTFTANQGSFASGEELWLFVFNAAGETNAVGLPVSF